MLNDKYLNILIHATNILNADKVVKFLYNVPNGKLECAKKPKTKPELIQTFQVLQFLDLNNNKTPGYALGIWICGFYKRELWASKTAGAHSAKSLKISGCKRWCPKDLRMRAPAAPVLTHSLDPGWAKPNLVPKTRKYQKVSK